MSVINLNCKRQEESLEAYVAQALKQGDQRASATLLHYWMQQRRGMYLPTLQDINLRAISALWTKAFLIDVSQSRPESFRFEYFGDDLVRIFGRDVCDEPVELSLKALPILGGTIGYYQRVFERHTPVAETGHFQLDTHPGQEVRYRSVILPLASSHGKLEYLLGTTNYKIYSLE